MAKNIVSDWVSVDKEKPVNDYNLLCYIMFEDSHKTLSDGGTVCNDATKQITHWMPIYKAAKYLPPAPKNQAQ